jgi:hypothetical protein
MYTNHVDKGKGSSCGAATIRHQRPERKAFPQT